MSEAEAARKAKTLKTIAGAIAGGSVLMGFYYRDVGMILQLKKHFLNDPTYLQLDRSATTLSQRVLDNKPELRAQLISQMQVELNELLAAAAARELEPRERSIWVVYVWSLLKLGALKNDNSNGLRFVAKHLR